MRKRFLAMLWIFPTFCMTSAQGVPQIKNIKIAVSNPSDRERKAADIVVPVALIRKVAPNFTPSAMIVTTSSSNRALISTTPRCPRRAGAFLAFIS